jgi:hypothetical protein
MSTECLQPVGGTVMRALKLDACGNPLTGVGSCKVVSEGFISVERTAEYADPDQFIQKNAAGKVCLKHRTAPQLLWYTYNIMFCEVDVDLYTMLSGSQVVLDDTPVTPNHIGWSTRTSLIGTTNWSLELWLPLSQEACVGANVPYLYWVSPWIHQGTISTPLTVENGPVTFGVSGAKTQFPSPWGVGPYNVQYDQFAAPEKLFTAIVSDEADRFFRTELAPPTAACGCTTVTPDA